MRAGLEKPNPKRARISAAVIASAYVAGGLIPLSLLHAHSHGADSTYVSVGRQLVALAIFGYVKGRYTGSTPLEELAQTTITGGLAASAAFSSPGRSREQHRLEVPHC